MSKNAAFEENLLAVTRERSNITHRIAIVYGTRPEAIKVAPLVRAIHDSEDLQAVTMVTAQHREMLDQVNEVFGIDPVYDLDIFEPGQSLSALMAKVFDRLDPVLVEASPDALVVQGDTTTVAAAAITAFYRKIPVIHVEAGLRSGDLYSPFPEEANRRITSQVTALHLAPTALARANLEREDIDPSTIVVTGNTVIDALLHTVAQDITFTDHRLSALERTTQRVLLVTTHRRENWGGAMEGIGRALRRLATAYPDATVVVPIHRNPIVRDAVLPMIEGLDNVLVTEPLPYGQFTRLMNLASVILTDSGGVQEEAPSLGKPVLVMRDKTERIEAVEAGTVRLVGTDENRIVHEVARLFGDAQHYSSMTSSNNPYGDGQAACRSVAAISAMLGSGTRLPDFSG